MEKKYVLDLTSAELPDWWPTGSPLKLPVRPGQLQRDIDLMRDEIDSDVYQQLFEATAHFNRGRNQKTVIGLDISSLPVGAAIRRIA